METREVLIADTKTQRKYTFMTAATTLGELQADMRANGINYDGMTFTEGITKTQLTSPDSMLPQNVMYHGAPTNNLIFLLTNTQKNIASGAANGRKEAYAIIKEGGKEVQEAIKREYGRNYTQVSTADLWNFIAENTEEVEEDVDNFDEEDEHIEATPAQKMVISIYDHIKLLATLKILSTTDLDAITEMTQELSARLKETNKVNISDDELKSMIANL